MQLAIMKATVCLHCLNTRGIVERIRLNKGQRVLLTPVGDVSGYYARPENGKWLTPDGDLSFESIAIAMIVHPGEVCIVTTQGLHEDIEDEGIRPI